MVLPIVSEDDFGNSCLPGLPTSYLPSLPHSPTYFTCLTLMLACYPSPPCLFLSCTRTSDKYLLNVCMSCQILVPLLDLQSHHRFTNIVCLDQVSILTASSCFLYHSTIPLLILLQAPFSGMPLPLLFSSNFFPSRQQLKFYLLNKGLCTCSLMLFPTQSSFLHVEWIGYPSALCFPHRVINCINLQPD
jgi:hypothetical protein